MEWKERYESNEDTEVFAIFIENRLTDDETFDIFFYRFPISRLSSVKPHFLSLFLSLHLRSQNGSIVYAFLTGTRLRVSNWDCVYITYEPLFPLSCHVPLSPLSPSIFAFSCISPHQRRLSFFSFLSSYPFASSLFRRTSISLNKLLRATPLFVDVHRKNVCVNLFARSFWQNLINVQWDTWKKYLIGILLSTDKFDLLIRFIVLFYIRCCTS